MSGNVNSEPKFLEESKRYLFCVLIFHATEIKKDITESSNVSCYSIYEYFGNNITFFSKMAEGSRFPIHSYREIFSLGCATAPAYVQPEKL